MFSLQSSRIKHKKLLKTETSVLLSTSGFLADLGKASGCSTNTFVTNSLPDSLSDPLVKIALQRRHALMVEDDSFSYKIHYVPIL